MPGDLSRAMFLALNVRQGVATRSTSCGCWLWLCCHWHEKLSDNGGWQEHRLRVGCLQQVLCRSLRAKDLPAWPGWSYLQHDTDLGPLLQVLTPNSLKLDTASERPPTGLFTIPSHAKDLMSEIEKKYQFWYELWNTDYIPLIARRQKWF